MDLKKSCFILSRLTIKVVKLFISVSISSLVNAHINRNFLDFTRTFSPKKSLIVDRKLLNRKNNECVQAEYFVKSGYEEKLKQ